MFEERTFLNVFTPKKITASEALYMKFAVIDTETTWTDEVMSIGIVIADGDTKKEQNLALFLFIRDYILLFCQKKCIINLTRGV